MKKALFDIFAATAPGFEHLCASELREQGVGELRIVPGGVEFTGDLAALYRANLLLRTANRVLVRVGSFRCTDFPRLYHKALRLPWGRFLRADTCLDIRAVSHGSRLMHTGRLVQTVADAVTRALGAKTPVAASDERSQLVLVRMENDRCQLSIDSSGDLLHRRGYRTEAGPAPLRETLASGLLMTLGWDGSVPLFDPFCGSGTIPIEAALLAGRRPPGAHRNFSFMHWPRYREGLWGALKLEADRQTRDIAVAIRGSDRDDGVVVMACANAKRAGVSDSLCFEAMEMAEVVATSPTGLLFCNPPYGARLGSGSDLAGLYRRFGKVCRRRFAGWRLSFLCPDPRLADATGLPLSALGPFVNGGLKVFLFVSES